MDEAIKALNVAGVLMLDVPEAIRRETFNLEPLMTAAEGKKDVIKYMAVVNKWRDLFLTCKSTNPTKEKERKPWQKQQQQQKKMEQLNLLM